MSLTSDLISQFVKATKDDPKEKTEATVYGTIVENDGKNYVKLDGSELLTPINTTVNIAPGERVMVTIKNHTATVTGNMSSPAARLDDIADNTDILNKITEFEIVIAGKVSTDEFDAEVGRIDDLVADNALIKKELLAANADIDNLQATDLEVRETLTAQEADIARLETEKLSVDIADAKFATIEDLEATDADIHNLEATYAKFEKTTTQTLEAVNASITELDTKKLDSEEAEIKYANIDFTNIGKAAMAYFYAQSGLIKDIVIGDATITGKLVGVTISGDLIEGNTIKAEKLVVKGSDGLYYKLNTDGIKTEAEQTDQNSLNGSIIKAKSITASKISVTDLVAFGATIGGFHITDDSIFSGTKSTVNNTTRGIYLDNYGQVAFGDSSNFVKFYKAADGSYKLAISADSILFGSTNKSIEQAIDDIEVGGRNLLLDSGVVYSNNEYSISGYIPSSPLIAGDTYTATICVTPALGVKHYAVFSSGGYAELAKFTVSGIEKQVVSATFTMRYHEGRTPEDDPIYANIRIYRYPNDGTVTENSTIHWVKIEKGNKPSDWSPAPEDTDAAINYAVDHVEVGARNLLLSSANPENYILKSYGTGVQTLTAASGLFGGANGVILDIAEASTSWATLCYMLYSNLNKIEAATEYTLSFRAYQTVDTDVYACLMDTNGTNPMSNYSNTFHIKANVWNHVSMTLKTYGTITHSNQAVYMRGFNNVGSYKLCNFKLEKGNKASDWSPAPEDTNARIIEATKTATNFMTYDTTNGVQVGDRSSGSWFGFRTQITGTAFNVLNQAGEVLASYGASLVELGKNSINAIIKLCGGKGQIEYDSTDEYLQVSGDKVRLKGGSEASIYSAGTSQKSAVNVSSDRAVVYSQKSNDQTGGLTTSEVVVDPDQVAVISDEISEVSRYGSTYESISGDIHIKPATATKFKKKVFISENDKTAYNDGAAGWYFGSDGTAHVTHGEKGSTIAFHYAGNQDTTSRIDESESGVISINGMRFGVNKVLWSGGLFMQASQTIPLSEAISAQANGAILVFSRYSDGVTKDYNWSTHFVPKAMVSNYNGGGQLFLISSDGSFDTFAAKYLYVYDTSIKGHDNNKATGTGACGIKYANNSYVLRYVIGV